MRDEIYCAFCGKENTIMLSAPYPAKKYDPMTGEKLKPLLHCSNKDCDYDSGTYYYS